MLKLLGRYKKAIVDLLYSFTAYALPTVVLQFLVFPLIASMTSGEENGLFLTLFNVVRLCVSVLVAPLGNIRLLRKSECAEDARNEKNMNFLFFFVTALSVVITVVFSLVYRGAECTLSDILLLCLVAVLICAHDYFSIAFRVIIEYKFILIDNILIIVGYAVGILLMRYVINLWEIIFICGYAFGLAFVLLKTHFWRRGMAVTGVRGVVPQYSQLCASFGLNNATIFCDKMIIYPMLGGYSVSVYNAAAIVSKVMSIISVPIRSVLLSYIVDADGLKISRRKMRKIIMFAIVGAAGVYLVFYLAGAFLCWLLYRQFFGEAIKYVPIILVAVLMDVSSGILKTVILRFAKTSLQLLISGVKLGVYVIGVLLLSATLELGLLGFCLAILFADASQLILVLIFFFRCVKFEKTK